MAGVIALVGGDEFRAGCEEMDRALIALTGAHRPSLLVIPTAAASENPSQGGLQWSELFRRPWSQGLGANGTG